MDMNEILVARLKTGNFSLIKNIAEEYKNSRVFVGKKFIFYTEDGQYIASDNSNDSREGVSNMKFFEGIINGLVVNYNILEKIQLTVELIPFDNNLCSICFFIDNKNKEGTIRARIVLRDNPNVRFDFRGNLYIEN